jgi:endoglucanase
MVNLSFYRLKRVLILCSALCSGGAVILPFAVQAQSMAPIPDPVAKAAPKPALRSDKPQTLQAKAVPAKAGPKAAAALPEVELPPTRASAIRLNQVGFVTDGPKIAVVVTDGDEPVAWSLKDAAGQVIAQGQTQVYGLNDGSNEHVQRIDASSFAREGEGYSFSAGGATSQTFAIRKGLYHQLARDAATFFYQQRSGMPIEAGLVGATWARPAGHPKDEATCYGPRDFRGNDWGGCAYTLDVSGGWYDAGDQGKYVVNGGISVWTLMNAYERSQNLKTAAFADGTLSIPEKANGVDDLLDEARYELEFLMRMQVPEGARLTLPLGDQSKHLSALVFSNVRAQGMAHHKVQDEHWTPLPTRPDQDHEKRYLSYPTTAATLNLAAVTAQCARVFKGVDDAFAARCLEASRKAYSAALRVPDAYAIDVMDGGGGAYGDNDVSDEFYWAAVELYLSTGEAQYLNDFKASPHYLATPAGDALGSGDISWGRVQALGTISLSMAANSPPELSDGARTKLIQSAEAYAAQGDKEGYGVPFSRAYVWGSNADMLNRSMILGLAYDFTGRADFRAQAISGLDYMLGRNPLNKSYVSGYGVNPMRHPHHRFWADVLDPKLPPPPPGVLAGGPQNEGAFDDAIKAVFGTCAPQTCYVDDIRAFSVNEVSVNGNAPLVWVAAFADTPAKK